jgi:hypothetical protein
MKETGCTVCETGQRYEVVIQYTESVKKQDIIAVEDNFPTFSLRRKARRARIFVGEMEAKRIKENATTQAWRRSETALTSSVCGAAHPTARHESDRNPVGVKDAAGRG